MVRYIKLNLDEEKFYALKSIKDNLELVDKKKLTWEDFLCEWVLRTFQHAVTNTFDQMLESVYSSLKEEYRKEFETLVKTVIEDKLRYYPK